MSICQADKMASLRFYSKGKLRVFTLISSVITLLFIITHYTYIKDIMVRIQTHKQSNKVISAQQLVLNKSQHECRDTKRPIEENVAYRNGWWQFYHDDNDEILLYSAYLDDRAVIGSLPVVRILAVSLKSTKDVYCQIWYPDVTQPYLHQVTVTVTGRGETVNGTKYGQYLYSCVLPASHPLPSHVSIVTTPCQNATLYLPIQIPMKSTKQHDFGVCVAVSYGEIIVSEFVEWIELMRLFGVTEFNIYNGSLSDGINMAFSYYIEQGVLNVLSLPPAVHDWSRKSVKLSNDVSLNDCMMRNMYRYRYMIVVDLDEIIVPRLHENYSSMLRAIDVMEGHSSPWRSYSFRNALFYKHFRQDTSQPWYLRTMRYQNRIKPSGFLNAPKSFIDPRTCLSVFNHYCYNCFDYPNGPWTIDVNTSIALSHHYRTCTLSEVECKNMSAEAIKDDILLKYKTSLDTRVKIVLKAFGVIFV